MIASQPDNLAYTTQTTLSVDETRDVIATLRFDTARMAASAPEGFALATDVAEWLVRRRRGIV